MATSLMVVDAVCYGDRSPAQWFLKFADGRTAYVRYRWGGLTATWISGAESVQLTDVAIFECPDGEVWFDKQIGGDLDGGIELARACTVLGLELTPGTST